MVPNEVDEQIETDEQILIENNDPTKNDNNNLPDSARNQQLENSFLVTPNGLVMEDNKSARKKNRKIYMVLPENKSPCQVSEIENNPKSAEDNSDQGSTDRNSGPAKGRTRTKEISKIADRRGRGSLVQTTMFNLQMLKNQTTVDYFPYWIFKNPNYDAIKPFYHPSYTFIMYSRISEPE